MEKGVEFQIISPVNEQWEGPAAPTRLFCLAGNSHRQELVLGPDGVTRDPVIHISSSEPSSAGETLLPSLSQRQMVGSLSLYSTRSAALLPK